MPMRCPGRGVVRLASAGFERSMKPRNSSKVPMSSSTLVVTDTSRWEALLSRGTDISKGHSSDPASVLTLGHRISVAAPPSAPGESARSSRASPAPLSVAARPVKSTTTKRGKKRQNRGDETTGESAASSNSNWMMLTGSGNGVVDEEADLRRSSHTTTGRSNGLVPRPEASSKASSKASKNNVKRRRAEADGQANTSGNHTTITAADSTSRSTPSSKSKRRTRKARTNRSRDDDGHNRNGTSSTGAHPTQAEHVKKSFKRPRSNVLNEAFQAQKAVAAAKEDGHVEGGGRGRGKAKAAWGGDDPALTLAEQAQYVGLDCEMVGVGPKGCRSALAQCCIVAWDGSIIYDKYVTPCERVTDFRTFVSGVKAKDLKGGLALRQCQKEVAQILQDKILVGHALKNDLQALMMSHPPRMTRDTATYRPYQKAHGKAGGKLRAKSLKVLSQEHLGRSIQSGQHNPAEDARAAMDLYKVARVKWEKSLTATSKMRGRKAFVDQQAS